MFGKNCKYCNKKTFRKKRSEAIRKNWLFCSQSCNTSYKNKQRKLPVKYNNCLFCKRKFGGRTKTELSRKFCSKKCSLTFRNKSLEFREYISKNYSGKNSWKYIDGKNKI